jgi:hypothetical protein
VYNWKLRFELCGAGPLQVFNNTAWQALPTTGHKPATLSAVSFFIHGFQSFPMPLILLFSTLAYKIN